MKHVAAFFDLGSIQIKCAFPPNKATYMTKVVWTMPANPGTLCISQMTAAQEMHIKAVLLQGFQILTGSGFSCILHCDGNLGGSGYGGGGCVVAFAKDFGSNLVGTPSFQTRLFVVVLKLGQEVSKVKHAFGWGGTIGTIGLIVKAEVVPISLIYVIHKASFGGLVLVILENLDQRHQDLAKLCEAASFPSHACWAQSSSFFCFGTYPKVGKHCFNCHLVFIWLSPLDKAISYSCNSMD
jgi:hypothetical protein